MVSAVQMRELAWKSWPYPYLIPPYKRGVTGSNPVAPTRQNIVSVVIRSERRAINVPLALRLMVALGALGALDHAADQGGAAARHRGAPATGLCAGAPARHGRAHLTATMDQDSSHSIQTGTGPVFLGFDCPARGHRV